MHFYSGDNFDRMEGTKFISTIFFLTRVVNVQRWERIISDEEDMYEKCKQHEEKQRAAIEEDKAQIEQLKGEKSEKKKEVDSMETEVNKARHDVATQAKEIHNIKYQISSIDTKVETKKNERHNILLQSKVFSGLLTLELHSTMKFTYTRSFSTDGLYHNSNDQR